MLKRWNPIIHNEISPFVDIIRQIMQKRGTLLFILIEYPIVRPFLRLAHCFRSVYSFCSYRITRFQRDLCHLLFFIRPFLRLAHCFRSAYSFCLRRIARLRRFLCFALFVPSFALPTAFAVLTHSACAEWQGFGDSSKISPLNTRRGTAMLFLFLCLSEILFVPIMIYGLYVVIFIKKIKNTVHLLDIFLTCQLNISLWNHSYFCRCHYYLFIL